VHGDALADAVEPEPAAVLAGVERVGPSSSTSTSTAARSPGSLRWRKVTRADVAAE
jgi:hypothetical protein